MNAIDLHVHSTYSDGTFTPKMLIDEAVRKGLSAMALTDHDTTDGIDDARLASAGTNVELIPGIELSCSYKGFKEIHIVGLFINDKDKAFNAKLEELRTTRDERNHLMCGKLRMHGIDISFDDMDNDYGNAVITRAHFADYLVKHGYVSSKKEAFDRYVGDNAPCFVPRRYLSSGAGIRIILDAKGVPILAHPTLYHLGNDVMRDMLAALKADGLAGMECIYSTYTMGEEIQMRRLAKEFGLISSGGSDFHGANKPSISLGTGKGQLFVPESILEPIRKLAH